MRQFALLVAAGFAASLGFACSSSDESSSSGGNGTPTTPGSSGGTTPGETPPKRDCAPSALAAVTTPPNARLLDLAAGAEGAWLLVLDTNGRSLQVVRPDGEKKVLADADATTGALSSRSDGKVCAAWGIGKTAKEKAVHYACSPAFEVEKTNVALEIDSERPLAFFDTPDASALLFMGKFASLDGMTRDKSGWRDANVQESSISYAGSTRALSGATEGSPYCWMGGGKAAIVESWLRGGSANTWGTLALDDKSTIDSCAVAISGSTLGVLINGQGKAKFATASMTGQYASPLVEEAFDAADLKTATLHADKDGFVVVYGTSTGASRAIRKDAGKWETSPLVLPSNKPADRVALVRENGREHIALSASGATFYQRSCAP